MGARYELSTSGRYGQRSKFCFFSHIFRWEAFFICRVPWPCSSRHVPWRQALFSRVAGSPALHRAPLNELRPVHHEADFGAPGLSRTREGGFRYRISILYRKRLFFTPNASENASRTGGSLFEHGAHIPYRRRPSPVPNSANARKEESIACTECFKRQKGEGYCLHRIYQTARKEKGMARNMSRNAAASKKITASVPKTQTPSITSLSPQLHTQPPASTVTSPATTATHPATHSANKKHHQYKTPPASTVTPPGCPKSPLLKVQSAFWAILAGVELTEGVLFGQAPPRAQKKKPRLNVTSIGTSEKRQLPTLPPGGAVPSALVSLTSLFGMGRGGSSPL